MSKNISSRVPVLVASDIVSSNASKADQAAKSWQKVVALLAAESKKVLAAIG